MSDESPHHEAASTDPPPVKPYGLGRRIILVSCGAALSLLLVIIILSSNRDREDESSRATYENIAELEHRELVDVDSADEPARMLEDGSPDEPEIALPQGGTLQFEDSEGRLAQVINAERLVPRANDTLEMVRPRATFYLRSGGTIVIEGESGSMVRRRSGLIESGSVFGDVRIRFFEPDDHGERQRERPAIIALTNQAEFDHVRGEIVCPEEVSIFTESIEFHGRELQAAYDEDAGLQDVVVQPGDTPTRIVGGALPEGERRDPTARPPAPRDERAEQSDQPTAPRPEPDAPADVYRAVFTGNVRIWRGGSVAQPDELITGDVLTLFFSMENSQFGGSVTQRPFHAAPRFATQSLIEQLVCASFAASLPQDNAGLLTPAPGPHDVYLTFAQRMVLTPHRAPVPGIRTPDDSVLIMTGTPVVLSDRDRDIRAECASLTYHSSSERIMFDSSDDQYVTMRTPEIAIEAREFNYDPVRGNGDFIGAGTMWVHEQSDAETPDDKPIELAWADRARLVFTPDEGDAGVGNRAGIDHAIFRGGVAVEDEQFTLTSDTLRVGFSGIISEVDTRYAIDRIDADGSVRIVGLGQEGRDASGDKLVVRFAQPADGTDADPQPERVIITGKAVAHDGGQTIRGDRLTAVLAPFEQNEAGPETSSPFGDLEVVTFRAENNVDVLLENGTRATGDLLVADPRRETADLTGEEVVVIRDTDTMSFTTRGRHAHVQREHGRSVVEVYGAGTADILEYAQQSEQSGTPADVVQTVHVVWSDRLRYDEGAQAASGSLDVRGDVRATSVSPLEDNSIESVQLRVDFVDVGPVNLGETASLDERQLQLERFVAKGNAKLETRSWQTPERSGQPRIMYIAGPHVEYDQMRLEAYVPGEGQLFIHDPWLDPPAEEPVSETVLGLTGKGSTLFEWTREMTMRERVDRHFDVVMQGDVAMRHSALDSRETAQLACGVLDVAIERRAVDGREPGLDFGGSARVLSFDARDSVLLRADGAVVDADRMTYHDSSKIAEIFGTRIRAAEVTPRGQHAPQRAEHFRWDMLTGKITIIKLSGRSTSGG